VADYSNTRWMIDNITRQVGDGVSHLFWVDPWIEGKPLCNHVSEIV